MALLQEHGYRFKGPTCPVCRDTGYIIALRAGFVSDSMPAALGFVLCPNKQCYNSPMEDWYGY